MSPEEKAEKDEVTINIGMPRPLHRRLSITCAVLDVSLKSALMAGAALWIDENAHAVASALPTPPPRTVPPTKKSRARPERDAEAQAPRVPESNPSVNEAAEANGVAIASKPEDRFSVR